jgi:hypothetical protein
VNLLKSKNNKQPILITGAPRSGTTFLGKIIAKSRDVSYVHEPFNGQYGIESHGDSYYYLHKSKSDPKFESSVSKILNREKVKYKLLDFDGRTVNSKAELLKKFYETQFSVKNLVRLPWKLIFRSKTNLDYQINRLFQKNKRVLIKDPTICLSSDYLAQNHDFFVVMLIRHPLAYVSSMKRLGWGAIGHRYFSNNTDLLENYLLNLKDQIKSPEEDDFDYIKQYSIDWNCFYTVLFDFIKNNPRIYPITHEKLSLNPDEELRKIFSFLELDYTDSIQKHVSEFTTSSNRTEAKNGKVHDLHRNSKNLIKIWRKRLSEEDISIIKHETFELASEYYDPDTWN